MVYGGRVVRAFQPRQSVHSSGPSERRQVIHVAPRATASSWTPRWRVEGTGKR